MKAKTWKDAFKPKWQDGGTFRGAEKGLTSLEGAPSRVIGGFDCSDNRLISLIGAPAHVDGNFLCSINELTSLIGAPAYVGGSFFCHANKLTSLKDIHVYIKHIGFGAFFLENPIESHVLGLLLIEGLREIKLDNEQVEDILNRHLPSKGMESVLEAQEELILAGYEEYAQL